MRPTTDAEAEPGRRFPFVPSLAEPEPEPEDGQAARDHPDRIAAAAGREWAAKHAATAGGAA